MTICDIFFFEKFMVKPRAESLDRRQKTSSAVEKHTAVSSAAAVATNDRSTAVGDRG